MMERLRLWVRRNPAMALAAVAGAAIVVADWWPVVPALWLGCGAALCLLMTIWRPQRSLWLVAGTMLVFGFAHLTRLQETYANPLRLHLLERAEGQFGVTARGWLAPVAEVTERANGLAQCQLESVQFSGQGRWVQPAMVKVRLPKGWELQDAGLYEVHGVMSLPKAPTNPGQFDGPDYLLRMGFVAELRATSCVMLERSRWQVWASWQRAANASARWISEQLTRGIENDVETSAVIQAIALGATDGADQNIVQAFRDSGTLHIFAVSGLHVAMVGSVVWFLLKLLGVRRSVAILVLIPLVFVYAFVTGWRPSAARAAMMIALYYGATFFERKSSLQNSLGVAALILLGADTHQLFSPGFQLSFGVLWAIAVGAGWGTDWLKPWTQLDVFLPPPLASWQQRWWVKVKSEAASLVCVSITAWMGSLFLMIGHFQSVTPVALVANCFLVPWSFFCMLATFLSLLFGALHFTGTQILLNQINLLCTKVLVWMAAWFSAWPMATFQVNVPWSSASAPVEMRVLHVPDGGAANDLRIGTEHWLLDTGSERNWKYVVRPYLRAQGVNHLQGVILSHSDADHIGGVPDACRALKPELLLTSTLEPWKLDPPFSVMRGLVPGGDGVPETWEKLELGQERRLGEAGAVRATALFPGPNHLREKADDRCLVLRLDVGRVRVLWMGDSGFLTEKDLLARQADVRCDILIRNQHASDEAGLVEFLAAAKPQVIIGSHEARVAEERLPERVREFCKRTGTDLFALDETGSVRLEFGDEAVTVSAFVGGRKVVVRAR